MTKHAYGWRRQQPDFRDFQYVPTAEAVHLPPKVDLVAGIAGFDPYDQGQLGSCTGNMCAGADQYDRIRQKQPDVVPSRLFLYYYARSLEGTVKQDSGATIRDVIKALSKYGAPAETTWPYDVTKFAKRPSGAARKEGAQHLSKLYQAVTLGGAQVGYKQALADGNPVCIGISVYESFESETAAQTGIIPYPQRHEQMLGGHAILLVGYDDSTQRYKFRNSWGTGWGDKGHGYLPYRYVHDANLASDAWVVKTVN